MAKHRFYIDPVRLPLALDSRYEAYALRVGHQIRDAAILVFLTQQRPDNEWRVSETTPPKYLASFRVTYYKRKLKVANTDPAWHLVEFGAHPGGDPGTFTLKYKPLTRGLLIVGSRFRGR